MFSYLTGYIIYNTYLQRITLGGILNPQINTYQRYIKQNREHEYPTYNSEYYTRYTLHQGSLSGTPWTPIRSVNKGLWNAGKVFFK